jgi:CreA protein
MKRKTRAAATLTLAFAILGGSAHAQTVGKVDTAWQLFGNHHIRIDAFDDPLVDGASCYVSVPVTGGFTGMIGVAEDPSNSSIACRQTGPIAFKGEIRNGDVVFTESRSLLFKKMKVTRFWDPARNTLVYITTTGKLIDGSPQHSLSVITLMPWNGVAPGLPKFKQ